MVNEDELLIEKIRKTPIEEVKKRFLIELKRGILLERHLKENDR